MDELRSFGEVLDAADRLSSEEKETLIDILRRRLIEHARTQLARDAKEAEKEFKEGKCQPATPSDLMQEILS